MAALAEALANDPQALAALVIGPQGLSETRNVALADEAEATAVAAPSVPLVEDSPRVADVVRTVAFFRPPPVSALSRLDLLV